MDRAEWIYIEPAESDPRERDSCCRGHLDLDSDQRQWMYSIGHGGSNGQSVASTGAEIGRASCRERAEADGGSCRHEQICMDRAEWIYIEPAESDPRERDGCCRGHLYLDSDQRQW